MRRFSLLEIIKSVVGRNEGVPESGNIVTEDGEVLGKHNGLLNYTIGQRKGLGIAYYHPFYMLLDLMGIVMRSSWVLMNVSLQIV